MAKLNDKKRFALNWNWVVLAVLGVAALFLFVHPDVVETANHSYLLLDSIFQGRFLHFYADVAAHPYGADLYYINNAHYNIVIYLIFAVAELPLYLFLHLFSLPLNEPAIFFTGKLVSAAFYVGCIPLVGRIARELGMKEERVFAAELLFALAPPAFFPSLVMGQYDSLCLLFILLGLLQWLRGRLFRFVFWMGLAAACKFFAFFLLIPLLLVREKRVLRLLIFGTLSLWAVLPTALLFSGRTGDMAHFNQLMINRLTAAQWSAALDFSIFLVSYLLVCVMALLWRPDEERMGRAGIWLCAASLAPLFLFVYWHPQWIILLVPFLVLGTLLEEDVRPWLWGGLLFCAGYFFFTFSAFPAQLEGNLLEMGLLATLLGHPVSGGRTAVVSLMQAVPLFYGLHIALFIGTLAAFILFQVPLPGGSPATRLGARGGAKISRAALTLGAWLLFGLGMAVWLAPVLYQVTSGV